MPHVASRSSAPALQADFAWRPALLAGLIASLVFQGLEILLIPLAGGGSPWGPTRMIAAMVLGRGVLPPPATFDLRIALVALLVDLALALVYSAIVNWLTRHLRLGAAVAAGALFGVALYLINFYGLIVLFPWFEMGRNGVTLFTHVVFSVAAVFAYQKLRPRLTAAA